VKRQFLYFKTTAIRRPLSVVFKIQTFKY